LDDEKREEPDGKVSDSCENESDEDSNQFISPLLGKLKLTPNNKN
jgi:hypothetical protein